jgi:hypothetical protein
MHTSGRGCPAKCCFQTSSTWPPPVQIVRVIHLDQYPMSAGKKLSEFPVGFAPPFEQKRALRSQLHLFMFCELWRFIVENLKGREHWEDLDVNEIRAMR